METQFQSVHSRCARYITGQRTCQNIDGTWTCPVTEDDPKNADFLPSRRNSIQTYAGKPLLAHISAYSKLVQQTPNKQAWWNLLKPFNPKPCIPHPTLIKVLKGVAMYDTSLPPRINYDQQHTAPRSQWRTTYWK